MKPTQILRDEHALIRQALDSCALAVEKLEAGERPPEEFFQKAVEFARSFSDKYHHFKEEYLMFARLAQKERGAIDPEIDSLRYQHERGRNLISVVSNSLDGYSRNDDSHTTFLLENLAAYTSLLRHHIHREDHVFYPMVDKELPEDEQNALLEEFKKQESKLGGKTVENCQKLVAEMGSLL